MTRAVALLAALLALLALFSAPADARVQSIAELDADLENGNRRRSLWSAEMQEVCKLSWAGIEALGSKSKERRCHRLIHFFCRRPGYLDFLRRRAATGVASARSRLSFCDELLYEPEVCAAHLAHGIATQMSACEREDILPNNLNRTQICSAISQHPECQETDGCIWREIIPGGGDTSRVASSGSNDEDDEDDDDRRALQNQPGATCVADPCFRINNGRCTLQHTGGRCVWYTQEQNMALRGVDNAGCYVNPCNNVKKQRLCENQAGNDYYKCTWCGRMGGTRYGCQAARSESYAQCFNIGAYEERCSECMPRKSMMHVAELKADCKKQTCAQQCCDSPFCTCGTIRTTENTGLNIITSG